MTCAVLSIGTELTRGELVNTNASWLSTELVQLGFEVTEHAVVDDDKGRIRDALDRLARTAKIIVCTGGLGPTTDDLTTEAVAKMVFVLGVEQGMRLIRSMRGVDAIVVDAAGTLHFSAGLQPAEPEARP